MDALHPESPAPALSADHTAIADSLPEGNTYAVRELERRQYELAVLTAISGVAARSPEVADVLESDHTRQLSLATRTRGHHREGADAGLGHDD